MDVSCHRALAGSTREHAFLSADAGLLVKILKGYENIDQDVFLICHSPAFVVIH